jgi:hypothetical protein
LTNPPETQHDPHTANVSLSIQKKADHCTDRRNLSLAKMMTDFEINSLRKDL